MTLWLLLASLVFCGHWSWRIVPLILLSVGADWLPGRLLADRRVPESVLGIVIFAPASDLDDSSDHVVKSCRAFHIGLVHERLGPPRQRHD